MKNSIIRTSKLTKFFGENCAVYRLDMKVPKAGIFGFLGPNGAGKTTAIKMLVGVIRPTYGTATIFGLDTTEDHVAIMKRVGYLPEHLIAYEHMKVFTFLAYMGRLSGLSRGKANERAKELLDWVGLGTKAMNLVRTLSAGETQRLGFANALVTDPDLLLLDEPTSNLDPVGRVELLAKIQDLVAEKQKTVLVSSHILPEIERICNYVGIINQSKIVAQGKISDLTSNEDDDFTLKVSHPEEFLKQLKDRPYVRDVWEQDGNIRVEVEIEQFRAFLKDVPKIISESGMELELFRSTKSPLEKLLLEKLGIPRIKEGVVDAAET